MPALLGLYQLFLALLLVLAGPFLLLQKKARAGLDQKLGAVPESIRSAFKSTRPIWFHAVSVGEFNAVWPLIQSYKKAHPQDAIFITTTTATGQKLAQEKAGSIARVGYFPFDLQPIVSTWLEAVNPRLVVIVETEIWPAFTAECKSRAIPICVVNGRISPRSFRRYEKLAFFFAPVLKTFAKVGVQSAAESARYKAIGGEALPAVILGNLKFDGLAPVSKEKTEELARKLSVDPGDSVFVVGSTHEGEETQIIDGYKEVYARRSELMSTTGSASKLRMILAPRHPERFDRVADLITSKGFRTRRLSLNQPFEKDEDVLLVDSIGQLFALYSLANVAFVGGSIAPIGGHNLLEPYAYGVPVLAGPHLDKTKDVAQALQSRNALVTVRDADEVAKSLLGLLKDGQARTRIGQAGNQLLIESQGAVAKALAMLEELMGHAPAGQTTPQAPQRQAVKGGASER